MSINIINITLSTLTPIPKPNYPRSIIIQYSTLVLPEVSYSIELAWPGICLGFAWTKLYIHSPLLPFARILLLSAIILCSTAKERIDGLTRNFAQKIPASDINRSFCIRVTPQAGIHHMIDRSDVQRIFTNQMRCKL